MNLPSREQVREAYNRLPRPIREYLASTELYDLSQELGRRHGLHIDTVGVLPDLISYLLVGLINPLQFQQALRELMIPSEPANAIVQELNEKVFKPLQEKVRNAPPEELEREGAPAEPVPAVQQSASTAASTVPAPSAPVPVYAPPSRTPAEPLVPPPSIAPRPAPAPMLRSSVIPPPITPEPRPAQVPPPAPAPAPQPMPTPIYGQPIPAPAYQPPVAPPPMPAPRPAAPPPANLPGANGPVPEWSGFSAMPSPVTAPIAPQNPASATPAPKPGRNDALHDIMKNYGVDPYREPPE